MKVLKTLDEYGGSKYFSHPLIKEDKIERRRYQEDIIASASSKNTLVVLPTGLGKTVIALGVAVHVLSKKGGKVLVLAPTKPLVEQHLNFFLENTKLKEEELILITGYIDKNKRAELWNNPKGKVYFATPQTVKNDIEAGILSLSSFSLIIFDEAHRAVGDYAYTYIARAYRQANENGLVLALTASPGGNIEKIGSVIANLDIKNVEVRGERDEDVKPYIQDVKIRWEHVEMTENMKNVDKYLKRAMKKRVEELVRLNILSTKNPTKKEVLQIQKDIQEKINKEGKDGYYLNALSVLSQLIKILYSIELLETQGVKQLISYYNKLREERGKTRAINSLLQDEDYITAIKLAENMYERGEEHPKMSKIKEIVKGLKKGTKAIIFTQYVETAEEITKYLKEHVKGKEVILFIGQRKGMTQKKQKELLDKFRKEGDVLVATSVAEEGLDIPKVDTVIFYEPIPSEIRSIQRRGRTGRFKKGEVIILVTKNSLDESYYWSSISRERRMRRTLYVLKNIFKEGAVKTREEKIKRATYTLNKYTPTKKIVILCDDRERELIKKLKEKATATISIVVKRLDIGDVVISDEVAVERKRARDFVNSIIDGRLFKQVEELIEQYPVPVIIIEGDREELFKSRNINENAIRGAISKIILEYQVPIVWTQDVEETAQYIIVMASRMQKEDKAVRVRNSKKVKSLRQLQEYFISGFPNINTRLAQRLLTHFGSVKEIVNASTEELMKVEGIGKKKAEKIKEVVEGKYEEERKEGVGGGGKS